MFNRQLENVEASLETIELHKLKFLEKYTVPPLMNTDIIVISMFSNALDHLGPFILLFVKSEHVLILKMIMKLTLIRRIDFNFTKSQPLSYT